METIRIKGLEIFAYHGVNPEEKENGQKFILDIAMQADISRAAQTDDLNETVNYAAFERQGAGSGLLVAPLQPVAAPARDGAALCGFRRNMADGGTLACAGEATVRQQRNAGRKLRVARL